MYDNQKESYRSIIVSTIFFGGAQIVVTLINMIRAKFVAVILGAAGMGLSSLLSNASACIQQIVLLGVNQSGVRDVSQASSEHDMALVCRISRILRTMILVSALIGMAGTVALSPLITRLSVGDSSYLYHFVLLGAVVLFNVLGLGEYAILQGTRQYKSIAYGTVVMPLCGLVLGIPIYYMWGMSGIVPAMILQSAIYYAAMRHFTRRYGLEGRQLPRVSLSETWQRGKGMITLGMVMMTAALLSSLTTYTLSAFISHTGSMTELGFFQAANTITMQCSSLVFTAMATDYYPKLAGIIAKDRAAAHRLVDQQTEIVTLTIAPISMIIISVVPLLISLLLTDEYQVIRQTMRFMGYAVIFKAFCFPVDYMSFANGDKRFFFWAESVLPSANTLVVFIPFFHFFGLNGLGYAALVYSVVDMTVSLALNYRKYGFHLSRATVSMFIRLTLIATLCLASSFITSPTLSYTLMGLTTLACCAYSYRQLDRRIGIGAIIRARLG